MQINILEYLENIVELFPNKIAFGDGDHTITFKEVYDQGRAIGTFLHNKGFYKEPIIIFMKKSPETIVAFQGTVYGGNYYVPIDEEMPEYRIKLILEKLNPKLIICDNTTEEIAQTFDFQGEIFLFEKIVKTQINEKALEKIRSQSIDTDPIYIVFTSGSTGIPKGVIANHRSVIDYIDNLTEILEVDQDTIFGNQTPLYLDASLKEIYSTLKLGATTYIIPKSLFSFPIKLVDFLNKYKINTICWVVTALTMISAFKVLDKSIPEYLHTIAFGSEVFPIKQFNLWRKALPNAKFINLYGPTETTGMCCFYRVNRDFQEEDVLPIGQPFKNTEILLLNDENKLCKKGEQGEICIRGTSLTLGYYKDFEKTREVFVQNPLNNAYPELIYRTGDIGKYNEWGELVFVSRKDHQVKHMGHRIELGEIDSHVNMLKGVNGAATLYNHEKGQIILFYAGDISKREVLEGLKKSLPRHMVPNKIKKLESIPLTSNGKIDRVYLKNII
ncbi:MAG TPA: amino acid adenylation domain-containing protein [Eubacteriaceae bacterium]|nr:amino acid adenylation domain-containing protein [Eubacteriaceae bacterium]